MTELHPGLVLDDFEVGDRVYKKRANNDIIFGTVMSLVPKAPGKNQGVKVDFARWGNYLIHPGNIGTYGKPLQLSYVTNGSTISYLSEDKERIFYEVLSYKPEEKMYLRNLLTGDSSWYFPGVRRSLEEKFINWELEG